MMISLTKSLDYSRFPVLNLWERKPAIDTLILWVARYSVLCSALTNLLNNNVIFDIFPVPEDAGMT